MCSAVSLRIRLIGITVSAAFTDSDDDLGQHAGRGRGDVHRDLVGLDLEQRLLGADLVADLLVPDRDRTFAHGLAELRHHDVHQPAVLRTVSTMRSTDGTAWSSS